MRNAVKLIAMVARWSEPGLADTQVQSRPEVQPHCTKDHTMEPLRKTCSRAADVALNGQQDRPEQSVPSSSNPGDVATNPTPVDTAPGSSDPFVLVTDWNKRHAWPPIGGLRHLIFHASTNGFDSVIRRVGRRVLIDEVAFFQWIDRNGRAS